VDTANLQAVMATENVTAFLPIRNLKCNWVFFFFIFTINNEFTTQRRSRPHMRHTTHLANTNKKQARNNNTHKQPTTVFT